MWVLVGSNPRLLNATTMADLLNQQVEAVRERADTQVGVIIDSFAAGDEVSFCTYKKSLLRNNLPPKIRQTVLGKICKFNVLGLLCSDKAVRGEDLYLTPLLF